MTASTEARSLARAIVIAGVCTAFAQVVRIVLFGFGPLAIAVAAHDAALTTAALRVLPMVGAWAVVSLMPAAGGLALRTGSAWARPLVVCGAVGALLPYLAGATAREALATTAGPALVQRVELAVTVVVPLLAALVLLVAGRGWTTSSDWQRWLVATLPVIALQALLTPLDAADTHALVERIRTAPSTVPATMSVPTKPPAPAPTADEVGQGRLVVIPTYDEKPIDPALDVVARIDLDDAEAHRTRYFQTRLSGGEIALPAIPTGAWRVHVSIDLERDNGIGWSGQGMPGDLVGGADGILVKDGEGRRVNVATQRLIRLLRPDDTVHGVPRRPEHAQPTLHSPVEFAWDPVPGATYYAVTVASCARSVRPRFLREVTLETTAWSVDLPPNEGDDCYVLTLTANRGRTTLGVLQVTGSGWQASEYRFRVVPPDVPTAALRASDSGPPDVAIGTAGIVVVPTIDGRAFEGFDGTPARIVLFPELPGVGVAMFDGVFAGSGIALADLPEGRYRVRAIVPLRKQGDFESEGSCEGSHPEPFATLANGREVRVEVPVACTIRLLAPQDTGILRPYEVPELPSPVTFAWSPLPAAVRYHYRIVEKAFDGGEYVVDEGDTAETTWTPALEPSTPRSQYLLTMSADGRHERVGTLQLKWQGQGAVALVTGSSYPFRVAGGVPQPGAGHLTIVPTYDGRPLDAAPDGPVEVWIAPIRTTASRSFPARLAHGEIDVGDVPTGIYGAWFELADADRSRGTLHAGPAREIRILRDGQRVRHEVPLYREMDLVRPRPDPSGPQVVPSRVTLEWQALDDATSYEAMVTSSNLPLTSDGRALKTRTAASTWTVELPPGKGYVLVVKAHGQRAMIAQAFTTFTVQ